MKKLKTKAIIAAVICIICVICATPAEVFAAKAGANRFEISLTYGYNNVLRDGRYCPFNVTVSNKGDDFEGSVWVVLPGIDGDSYAYEQKLSLPGGSEKTATIYGYVPNFIAEIIVKITDNKEHEVYSKSVSVNFYGLSTTNINVGILSDDVSAFNLLGSSKLIGYDNIGVNLIPLKDNMLNDHPKAYDFFDFIIISDYSTDRLTSEQITALFDYVQGGGVLYIGTGATASKTLSGLRDFLPIQDGLSQNVMTDFGLQRIDQFSVRFYQSSAMRSDEMVLNLFNRIDWKDYTEACPETGEPVGADYLFSKYEEYIYVECFPVYAGWEYTDAQKYCDPYELKQDMDIIRENFYDHIYPMLSEKYYSEVIGSQESPVSYSLVSSFFSGVSLGTPVISDSQGINLAYRHLLGKGYVFVFPFDLTSGSFITYPNADMFLLYFFQEVSQSEVNRLSNTSTSGSYWARSNSTDSAALDLLNGFVESPLLPLLAYVAIFIAYLTLSFIAYFRLRKHKRSIYLWAVQGAFSIIAVILVLASSIATRQTRPVANIAEVTLADPAGGKVKTLCTVTFPKNSKYTIPFARDFYPDIVESGYYRAYGMVSDNKVSREYLDVPGTNSLRVKTAGALSSVYFTDESVLPVSEFPDIVFNAKYDPSCHRIVGTLENNTNTTYTDCFVFTDYAIIPLKEIKPGQKLVLDTYPLQTTLEHQVTQYSEYLYVNKASHFLFSYYDNFSKHVLGFDSGNFKEETLKTNILHYVFENDAVLKNDFHNGLTESNYQFSLWTASAYTGLTLEDTLATYRLGSDYLPEYQCSTCWFMGFSSDNASSILARDADADATHIKLLIVPSTQNDYSSFFFDDYYYEEVYYY